MGSYIMGIDLGITRIKVSIFNEGGISVASGSATQTLEEPQPGYMERNPELLWQLVSQTIKKVLATFEPGAEAIQAIGICGHGDGAILLDKQARPVRPPILSLDERSRTIVSKWVHQELHKGLTYPGMFVRMGNPLPILAWLKKHEAAHYKKARWLIFTKDWIKLKLTGQVCTDRTDVSALLLGGVLSEKARKILQVCNIPEIEGKLPPIVPGERVCGAVHSQASEMSGLRAGTPVVSGLFDLASSMIGAGCLKDGDLLVSLGTWGCNAIVRDTLDDWEIENQTLSGYAYVFESSYILLAPTPGSVGNIDWFRNAIFAKEPNADGNDFYQYLEKTVTAISPEECNLLYHPYLYGTNIGTKRYGAFLGLSHHHQKSHLLRAVLEGVAFNHRLQVDILATTGSIGRVCFSGGGAKSHIWSQIFADVLNRSLHIPDEESGVLGSAMAAAIGCGWFSGFREAAGSFARVIQSYEPSAGNIPIYDRRYKEFQSSRAILSEFWTERASHSGD